MKFKINKIGMDPQINPLADISSGNVLNFTIPLQATITGNKIQGSGSINSGATQITLTYDLIDPNTGLSIQNCPNVIYNK